MKKQWKKCVAASAFTLTLAAGSGSEMLMAFDTGQEMPGNPGGGVELDQIVSPRQFKGKKERGGKITVRRRKRTDSFRCQ